MSYRVLVFEPSKSNSNSDVILWKAQITPPPNYISISTVLISDNIEVNNRRPVEEWEKLLRESGFKYELNYNHDLCKEYIIFDTDCVVLSFQIFACGLTQTVKAEVANDHILSVLEVLNLKKQGTIFPQALMNRIENARNLLKIADSKYNYIISNILSLIYKVAEECQIHEIDTKYHIVDMDDNNK